MASVDLPIHRVVFLVGTSQFYQLVKEAGWQHQSPSNNCFHILPLAPKVTDNSGDCYGIEGSWKDHFISLRRQLPFTGIRCCFQAQCQSKEGVSETYFLPLRLLIIFHTAIDTPILWVIIIFFFYFYFLCDRDDFQETIHVHKLLLIWETVCIPVRSLLLV